MTINFYFVVACLCCAAFSFFFCTSKKDWVWLNAGLLFTVISDYFLVLYDMHLPGVAVFCFTHYCYAMRVMNVSLKVAARVFFVLLLWVVVLFSTSALYVLAGTYAVLFVASLWLNYRHRNKPNGKIILVGLILFMLCDINVLLYNVPGNFPFAQSLIWVFYLPSQMLLAVSAIAFPSAKE